MMLMMMNAMKNNPNVDKDWIEYCLPRMMEQMKQMSEEFKRKKMDAMVSNDEFAKLKQVFTFIPLVFNHKLGPGDDKRTSKGRSKLSSNDWRPDNETNPAAHSTRAAD